MAMPLGCGEAPPPLEPAGGGGGYAGTTSTTSTGQMTNDATLLGVVMDAQGQPLADAFLGLCANACWASASASDGRFAYEKIPPGDYHLDVRIDGTPGGADVQPTTGTISVAMALTVHQTLELPPLFVPDPGAATRLVGGPQRVEVSGLSLTADPAEWSLPVGVEGPYLSAVRVPEAQWPPNPVEGGEVLARWALNPYGTASDQPMPLTVDNDLGLAAKAEVGVFTLDPSNGKLERETTGTVSADGSLIEAPAGITRVTWIVLAQPR